MPAESGQPSSDAAYEDACPICGEGPGEHCIDLGKPGRTRMELPHKARVRAALARQGLVVVFWAAAGREGFDDQFVEAQGQVADMNPLELARVQGVANAVSLAAGRRLQQIQRGQRAD